MIDKTKKMMYDKKNNSFTYFLYALALLFIYLKLTVQITWSWWLVLSPIWIPMVIGFIVGFIKGFLKEFK